MDINPLIADLNRYKEELIDSIQIAIGFNELNKADRSLRMISQKSKERVIPTIHLAKLQIYIIYLAKR